jgi:hypothetical protein
MRAKSRSSSSRGILNGTGTTCAPAASSHLAMDTPTQPAPVAVELPAIGSVKTPMIGAPAVDDAFEVLVIACSSEVLSTIWLRTHPKALPLACLVRLVGWSMKHVLGFVGPASLPATFGPQTNAPHAVFALQSAQHLGKEAQVASEI